jgi:peptidyl-prolyl cis-trans isomerase C
MASFAHDRRSSDRRLSARLTDQPRRRAFDLLAPANRQASGGFESALENEAAARAIDELLVAALGAIEHAAAPSLEEVLDMARRAEIAGAPEAVLRDPAVAELIAGRFTAHPLDARACRRYYDLNLAAFRTPDLYEGREILLGCDLGDTAARTSAYSRAEQIIAMLLFNRKVFKDLLIYSAAKSRFRDGVIGPVARDDWRGEIADAFFSLKPNEIFPLPLPSAHGFYVLTLDRITAGALQPFAQVEREIARFLEHESRLAAARRHLDRLTAQLSSPAPRVFP